MLAAVHHEQCGKFETLSILKLALFGLSSVSICEPHPASRGTRLQFALQGI
jgi:hypothetical protein